jgi:hypothetical protein
MKTPEPEIREQLYENVALQFERAVLIILETRSNANKKAAALYDVVKLAYQSGLDRGYDLGSHVFGDGSDDA